MVEQFDVAVIGAGIVGVPAAQHLLIRGQTVGLFDRRGPGLETSYGNSGIIGNSYVLPFGFPSLKKVPQILLNRDTSARVDYLRLPKYLPWLFYFYRQSQLTARLHNAKLLWPLVHAAVEEHQLLMANSNASQYMKDEGRVALYRTAEGFAGSALERRLAQELGVPFDVMTPVEFAALEPDLAPVYHRAIRWKGSKRIDNPSALVAAYADRFVREGGQFINSDVKTLAPRQNGGWQIETVQGLFAAKQVVVAMGPWAADFLKPFGYHFPMAYKRGYHGHFPAKNGAQLAHAIVDATYGYVMSPMQQGYRLTTGAHITDHDAPPDPAQLAMILPKAREFFPLGEMIEPKPWYGSRPCFADSLPVIGTAPHHPGIWFNFGHGHLGLTIGLASGRLLAQMMLGEQTFCDPAPYRAERFTR